MRTSRLHTAADVATRVVAVLTVTGLAGLAGTISYQHMVLLALIWSSRRSITADLGVRVVDMFVTGGRRVQRDRSAGWACRHRVAPRQ